jgi:signal transduction histidine kinase
MQHGRMWGLRPKIIAAFILLSILPVLVAGISVIWQNYTTRLENVTLFQKELTSRVLLEVNTHFSSIEQRLEDMERYHAFDTLSESEKRSLLSILLSNRKNFTSATYVGGGEIVGVSNKMLERELEREAIQNSAAYTIPSQSGLIYYSEIYSDVEIDEPAMTLSYPINDRASGENIGVILTQLRLKPIWELFADLRLPEGEDIYLTDSQGRIVAHQNPSVVLSGTVSTIHQEGFQHDFSGNTVYAQKRALWLGEQRFELVSTTTLHAIISPYFKQAIMIAAVVGLLIFTFVLLFFYISTTVIRRIERVGEALKEFNVAERFVPLPYHNHDEIGELSDKFNAMALELKQIHSDLEGSRDILEEEVEKRTKELIEANTKLKELDTLKSMFIASMSHELRTPLNSIIGFTGIILQGLTGEINEKQKEYLSRVKLAGHHLLSLISDVIDISKIEAGRLEAIVEEFSLSKLLDEAKEEIEAVAAPKGLSVVIEMESEITMRSDRRRLYQCLLNYLSNAVKFTETSGKIVVRVEEITKEVRISVIDNGIGISPEDQGKLFEAFERLESHLRVKAGGTGLGLYLTKKITEELLGGEVFIRSALKEGSTFGLQIPIDLHLSQKGE